MNARTGKGFTLTELIISTLLVGLVILSAVSADLTSRQFFKSAEDIIRVQDEAKIAMEHIAKNVSRGIGSLDSPAYTLSGPTNRIRVNIDGLLTGNTNGRFGDAADDGTIEYEFDTVNHRIVFDPNTDDAVVGDKENITTEVIANCSFSASADLNRIDVFIEARRDPTKAASNKNPEVSLSSSVVLRAMSCN
ncbi:MAG: hypothetical protein V1727_03550 [Candidatus Omnitrophota bacterium]